jgi:tRNA A-37 threonylcarbamoyl transferase component Bud32
MNMTFEPMVAAIFGGWELLLILAVTLVLIGLPLLVALIIYFIVRANRPGNSQPVPGQPAAPVVPAAAPLPTKTVVMARQCPQCQAALAPDASEGLCPACLLQRGFATEGAPSSQAAFVPPSIAELAPLFPQLEILECLGRGGMGAVYKARQPRLDRFVALKILSPEKQNDPQFAERFEREARVLARLSHPHIVSVFDSGVAQGRYYLLMEFVDGLTLRQVLQPGKLSPAEALQLVPQICDALQYAHQQGIVHRDIKPENILLDKQGQLKIADFGIAKIAGLEAPGLSLTGVRDVMGTPHYMAPEQVEQPQSVDHRADIYSLGVVFYEMLTGELPLGKFASPSTKVQVDVRLDEVVLRSLEKEPARRYQQASQVKTDVETIAGTPPRFAPAPLAAAGNAAANSGLLTAPAAALMVVGGLKLLNAVVGTVFLAGISGWLGHFFGNLFGLGGLLGLWGPLAIFSVVFLKVLPGCFMMFGGWQMLQRRSYGWSIAAGILAIVSCSLLAFPIGIWALIVLARDDAKAMFGVPVGGASSSSSGLGTGFMWIALALLGGLMVMVITLALTFMSVHKAAAGSSLAGGPPLEILTPQQLQQAGLTRVEDEFHKDFSQSFPLGAAGRFSVDNVDGRINIHGWSSNLVVVTAVIHGKSAAGVEAVTINIDADASHLGVHTKLPSGRNTNHNFWDWLQPSPGEATVDYTIQVPRDAHLAGVSSVNGHIDVEGVAGDITASTVNGKTQITGAAHDLKLSTVNGQIRASLNELGRGQTVSLDAVNGRIDLELPENASAKFSVTSVNGSIASQFPPLKAKKEFPIGNDLNGRLGDGEAKVQINVVNGTVHLLKSPARSGPVLPERTD